MDFLLFWYEHNQRPVLTQREQLVFCAKAHHAGYLLSVALLRRRLKRSA